MEVFAMMHPVLSQSTLLGGQFFPHHRAIGLAFVRAMLNSVARTALVNTAASVDRLLAPRTDANSRWSLVHTRTDRQLP